MKKFLGIFGRRKTAEIAHKLGVSTSEENYEIESPIQKAYNVLYEVQYNKKKVTKLELTDAIEEAMGYLGEFLDD